MAVLAADSSAHAAGLARYLRFASSRVPAVAIARATAGFFGGGQSPANEFAAMKTRCRPSPTAPCRRRRDASRRAAVEAPHGELREPGRGLSLSKRRL